MIGSEEKLEILKNSVLSDVRRKSDKIISKAKQENAKMIIDISDKQYVIAEKEIENGKGVIRSKYAAQVQSYKAQARKELLEHRQELVGKVFSLVEQKLIDFASSKEYPEYLRKAVKNCGVKSGEIKLCAKDHDKRDELLGELAKAYTVSLDDTFFLGGLKLIPEGENIVYDFSFDTALEIKKEGFGSGFDLGID